LVHGILHPAFLINHNSLSELAEKLARGGSGLFNFNPLNDPNSSPMQQLVQQAVNLTLSPACYLASGLPEELIESVQPQVVGPVKKLASGSVEMLAPSVKALVSYPVNQLAPSPAEELFHPVTPFIL